MGVRGEAWGCLGVLGLQGGTSKPRGWTRETEKQRERDWDGGAENRQQLGGGIPEGKGDQLLCQVHQLHGERGHGEQELSVLWI